MKKIMIILCSISLLYCPFTVFAEETTNQETKTTTEEVTSETKKVTLEKCVDGDTATFKDSTGNTYKTRFLAIDTPETVHPTKGEQAYGKDASTYTCETLTNAKEIVLETDPASDEEDKYGRLLAWVFVDGVLLQEQLINNGLAQVSYLYGDYKYTEQLELAQATAKTNKIGIWSSEEETESLDTETVEETSEDLLSKNDKNFIEELIDNLLGKIFDYIDSLIERIASWIEDML